MIRSSLILASLAAAGIAADAAAQDYSLSPSFGSVELRAGFLPDPHVRNLTAGGAIRVQDRMPDCRGYIANAPDYSLHYTAGSAPLYINVDSDRDTTLIVNGPNAQWYCDDDGADEPLNPLLYWSNPPSGRYDIWVGTYSSGAGAPATLFISEIGENTRGGQGSGGYAGGVNIGAPAINGDVTLRAGFLPDPFERNVTAGGPLQASSAISSECRGYVTSAPTLELNYDGSGRLHIYTHGGGDTVLAVNRPDGSWTCNDDGGDGLNAGLSFSGSTRGVYDIYVGTYGTSQRSTTLMISEIALGHTRSPK
ncbi:peptidase [Marinicauda salina]|uniref:peptidase n=1 Tax=Marinicauda salina TaxID=2135793 RepID=UPI0018EE9DBC|nr:peptidase [Marinicauda salina]